MFDESEYSVIEGDGPVELLLTISKTSLIDITVQLQVISTDGLAIGEYYGILIVPGYYNGMTNMLQEEVWIIL